MGYFYFDESIQSRGNFIVGAFVYSETDLTPIVLQKIAAHGLVPGKDEFKSSFIMRDNDNLRQLRSSLSQLLIENCSLGLVVAPEAERKKLGSEALTALANFIKANGLEGVCHEAYFDEEINFLKPIHPSLERCCKIFADQKSELCAGIQVADYAAHRLGSMLLQEMGLITKTVLAGEGSGYLPETEFSLGFELWASLRYAFFRGPPNAEWNSSEDITSKRTYEVLGYGLHIADSCNEELKSAAIRRFGEVYLGCIH